MRPAVGPQPKPISETSIPVRPSVRVRTVPPYKRGKSRRRSPQRTVRWPTHPPQMRRQCPPRKCVSRTRCVAQASCSIRRFETASDQTAAALIGGTSEPDEFAERSARFALQLPTRGRRQPQRDAGRGVRLAGTAQRPALEHLEYDRRGVMGRGAPDTIAEVAAAEADRAACRVRRSCLPTARTFNCQASA